MADPVLHIKDAYFFEVPKVLWPRKFESKADVAKVSEVWVELDDQFQAWELERQYHKLTHDFKVTLPPEEKAHHDWEHWTHEGDNHGKPFDEFLASKVAAKEAAFQAWKKEEVAKVSKMPAELRAEAARDAAELDYGDFKSSAANSADDYDSYVEKQLLDKSFAGEWAKAKEHLSETAGQSNVDAFVEKGPAWSEFKLGEYSKHLAGKVLIPQPFGKLRNLHEADSGLTITKYMIVEVGVALIVAILFSWLARRVMTGGAPKGRLWNLLETFVLFIRDQVAVPAIGDGHHDEHPDDHHHSDAAKNVDAGGHPIAAAANAGPGLGGDDHSHRHGHGHRHAKKAHAVHVSPARQFTPLLCSIFFFILGCNLAGMLPWIGSPTAVFSNTLAMAMVTLATVFVSGMIQFGFLGFFKNQIPSMDMPWYMAMVMKPMIFAIEFGGLFIKHGVLAVRLLANMVAGHLVLLAIMGLAFGAAAAVQYTNADTGEVNPMWWLTSTIVVVGCALLSVLELFVAFLQAFVFTMLSALFIGAAIHKH
jgi:F-type H+-transporting ATPase subunit a